MRLRPALMTCVIAALVVVGLGLTNIAVERQATAGNDAQHEAAEFIARDAASLLALTQDYGLHPGERAARQWQLVHERLSQALAGFAASDTAAPVPELREAARRLPQIFAALRTATADVDADAGARRELLTNHLVNETRRVSDGAFELSRRLAEARSRATARQRWLSIAAQGALLALNLLLAGLLLRRVLAPIDRLRSVAQAVEGGDLAARSALPAGDELGQLSQALDAMTGAQQQRDAALRDSNRDLARSESFLARAGRMAGVGGWELDIASGRLNWTAQAYAVHGVPPGTALDAETLLRSFVPESEQRLREAIIQAERDGSGWDLELQLLTPDDQLRWLHHVGAAEAEQGRVVRLVGAVQDITERRAAAAALRHATQVADAANAAKSRFLANMSHEIRTPMNAVIGLNFLLGRGALEPGQRDLVAKIGSASRALLDVINDILDLSKIEAAEMLLECAPFDPGALLGDIASLYKPQAEAKGVALRLALDPGLPALLLGDVARLRQIVGNLVSNAIKFTAQGHIEIAARGIAPASEGAPPRLEITVTDSGIGIAAEALPRLFMPFTQADGSTARRYGGTGLGLAIVRQLCELMGGTVEVDSEPGRGTRFLLRLPFEPAPGLAPPTRPLSLLVACAEGADCQALLQLCADLGWQAEPVAAAAALHERLRGTPPDLVLLDPRLPATLAAAERELLEQQLAALPCLHLAQAAEAAGPGWLPLPADLSSLFDAAHATLAASGADRPLLASTRDAAALQLLPGVRVLAVDDSPINLEVVQHILEQQGAHVTLAADGAAAVAALQAAPAGFDAVLMDVQMPVLDGLGATRRIRGELGLRALPILALTAGALLSERERALAAGMDGFVSKPFDAAGLVLLLRQQVERAQGRRLPVAAGTAAPQAADDWPQFDGVARNEVRQRLRGDVELFARLLERLLDDYRTLATAAPPTPATAGRLHKLGGSAGLLAAQALSTAARRAEATARDGADCSAGLAEVARLLTALDAQARPWLLRQQAALAAREASAAAAAPAPPPAELARLRAALAARELAALDLFKPLAPALRAACGEAGYAALRDAIMRLDFAAALDELNALPVDGAPA